MPELALRFVLLTALSGVALATFADTETYYKWRDKDGKITYQTKPPPKNAMQVEKIQYDPEANIVPAEPLPGGTAPGTQGQGSNGGDTVRRGLDDRGADIGAAQREALDRGDSADAPDGGADTAEGAATADPGDPSAGADPATGADTASGGDLAPGAEAGTSGSAAGTGSTAAGAATGSPAGAAAGAPVAAPPPLPPAAPVGP